VTLEGDEGVVGLAVVVLTSKATGTKLCHLPSKKIPIRGKVERQDIQLHNKIDDADARRDHR
jgi:hypothetical protein